jgi:hypothetical protein
MPMQPPARTPGSKHSEHRPDYGAEQTRANHPIRIMRRRQENSLSGQEQTHR